MKKIVGMLTLALAFMSSTYAQETTENTVKKVIKPSRDFVMFQLTYENWYNTPDSVKVGGIGRGFNAYLCYDFPIAKSNFSFAAGIGVGTSNIYFNDQLIVLNGTGGTATFRNVDSGNVNVYKKSKLTTAYLEAPFELRFFGDKYNRNRGFKMALGARVGMLINAHSKNKNSLTGPVITEKVSSKNYFQTWRIAPTFRVGWGNFSLYGSMNVTQLFNSGQGPEVYPYSIGVCITGL